LIPSLLRFRSVFLPDFIFTLLDSFFALVPFVFSSICHFLLFFSILCALLFLVYDFFPFYASLLVYDLLPALICFLSSASLFHELHFCFCFFLSDQKDNEYDLNLYY